MHDAEIRVRTKVDTGEFGKLGDAMRKTKELLGKGTASLKNMGASIKNVFEGGVAFVKSFTKALLASFGKFALIALLVKGLKKAIEGLKEGFKNYYKESASFREGIEQVKNSGNNLKDSLSQLKNAFISAFAPIVEMILPYIAKFIDWIAIAVEWITKLIDRLAQLIAYLRGKDTYMRAKKNVGAYNKELEKSVKLNKQLASFDELNVLRTSGGGDSGAGASDLWEEVPLDETLVKTLDYIKDHMAELRDLTIDILGKMHLWTDVLKPFKVDLGEIRDFFGGLWSAVTGFFDGIRDSIQGAIDKVREFLGKIGEIIGRITATTQAITNAVRQAFSDWINGVKNMINDFVAKVKGVIDKIKEMITKVTDSIKKVINGIKTFIEAVNVAFDFLFGNLYRVADTAKLIWQTLKEIMSFDLPILPTWQSSPSVTPTPRPKPTPGMATGGVVTAPTMALIGEAGREVVLPLESNTEWMDALADRITNTVVFRVEGDVNRIFKVTQEQANQFTRRTGKPAFT